MSYDPKVLAGHGDASPLAEVTEALREGLGDDLVAVVLFGSRARDDARPESDWDLLVIASGLPPSPLHRVRQIASSLPFEWRFRTGILACTPEEFLRRVTPLDLDLALDGVVLFDPRNFVRPRLADLQEQINDMGLVRRELAGEWAWMWRGRPRRTWSLEWQDAE